MLGGKSVFDNVGGEKKNRLAAVVMAVAFAAALVVSPVLASSDDPGGRPFETALTGAAERPGPGDPDGSGFARVTLNQGLGIVCFDITVANIDPVVNAHIHVGDVTVAGPVVVGFDPVVNGLSGCVTADPELIKTIRQNPENYYVNVHTTVFPAGAIRGQLSK